MTTQFSFTKTHSWILLLVALALQACAGAASTTDPLDSVNDNQSTELTDAATEVAFQASLTILPENTTDFGESFTVDLSDEYVLPLSFDHNNQLSFAAQDFPTIVYRICNINSTSEDCDYYSDIEDIVDMDLVFDSCDRLVKEHSECGDDDGTVYTGSINEAGELNFTNIAIRTRLFFVTASGSSGYTATPTMAGSITDLSRISLDLTTETVSVDEQTSSGSAVDANGRVTLLGTGTIPEKTIGTLPSLGVSSFIAEIDGEFSENPFELMAE